ncbi:M1 family aminopeptidase [Dyadobacter sp. CY323]|uniref:M1 family aminopeptidase n=1 Tax=Dyadobacter sp. CY323 TaxID=2907302 RepID=UPI001F35EA82|nr:M1 family aminopeptidase [Dyadobacter sp. CY323]MCE6987549.1 hypothetical protein [Dyadobacter sp. CY323]
MKSTLLPFLFFLSIHTAFSQESNAVSENQEIVNIERKGFQRQTESLQKSLRTSSSNNFDVKYYRCEWEVDPAIRAIKGTVTTHFVTTAISNDIVLDLTSSLTVNSVKKGNIPLSFTRAGNLLTITLQSALAAGVSDSVSVTYEGVPPAGGFFVTSTHGSGVTAAPVLWTLSEPYGSHYWWPCKNGIDDKADSIDVYITHPATYKAVSNGVQVGTAALAGKTVTHWKHRYAIASYLVCMAVSNYVTLNDLVVIGPDNVAMQTFCYPENQASFATGAQTAMAGLTFFSNLFGSYPFKKEKYGHIQFGWSGGMEHQTGSFMVNTSEMLVAHELAHQWFGDKITCGNWEDVWLNEGFASHLANMYLENKYPATIKTRRTTEINSITSLPGGSVRVDNVNDENRIFSNRLSYLKGSHLLYLLRWILGDAVFFTAVNNYLADPALAYGFATTDKLKNHLEASSGKNLTYFFDQWYTGQGFPSYQVDWFPQATGVQVKLKQTTSHASVGFFQLPVPLLFRNSVTNEEKLVILNNTFSGQTFNENLGFEANELIFDPDVWLITRNNTLTKLPDPLPVTFSNFKSICAGGDVMLEWETSEEKNADFFEIQKSSDAIRWNGIGRIEAAGNSLEKKTYSFRDIAAAAEHYYYRVAEKDYDGKMHYTRIISSQCRAASRIAILLAPNPVKNRLIFRVDNRNGGAQASVLHINGTAANSRLTDFPVHDNNDVDVGSLPGGLYILKLRSNDGSNDTSVRFLKE